MHLEMALNFCMEHDQHTLHNGEAQEISELAGWGVLRQDLIPPKESLRHFSETKVCCLAPLPALSLQLNGTARAREGGAQGAGSSTHWIPFLYSW